MLQTRLYCPSCKEPLYEYDFQLEGEVAGPDSTDSVGCELCGWKGAFGELSDSPPVLEPAPDFQI